MVSKASLVLLGLLLAYLMFLGRQVSVDSLMTLPAAQGFLNVGEAVSGIEAKIEDAEGTEM